MTHDYKRHGTTTLFAALDVATGEVIHECLPRYQHQEFLRFLRKVERLRHSQARQSEGLAALRLSALPPTPRPPSRASVHSA